VNGHRVDGKNFGFLATQMPARISNRQDGGMARSKHKKKIRTSVNPSAKQLHITILDPLVVHECNQYRGCGIPRRIQKLFK